MGEKEERVKNCGAWSFDVIDGCTGKCRKVKDYSSSSPSTTTSTTWMHIDKLDMAKKKDTIYIIYFFSSFSRFGLATVYLERKKNLEKRDPTNVQ